MKLKKVSIRNFKRIDRLDIDFTDSLGRIRDMTVIAGPNGCGKTTILDAIAYPLCSVMKAPFPKSEIGLKGNDVIRGGAIETRVDFDIVLEPDEYQELCQVTKKLDPNWIVLNRNEGYVTWRQPLPPNWQRGKGWTLLRGRRIASELIGRHQEDITIFNKLGGLFYFDQERSIPARTSPKHDRITPEILDEASADEEELVPFWANIKQHLVNLGVDAKLAPDSWQADRFRNIQEIYARLFEPRQLIEVRPRGESRDLCFRDGDNQEYWFDSLSSGEKQCLLFIMQFAAYRIHRSIVLIDEVGLHLHPTLQIELLKQLPRMGDNNQFIVTTHSPYVFDFFPPEHRLSMGTLYETEEQPA